MSHTREVTRSLSVRELRDLCGLSLADLAKEVGISEGMLSYYETGQRTLAADTEKRLHKILTDALTGSKKLSGRLVDTSGVPVSAVTATYVIGTKP
jgi:transcriptional regulator with XRE-family HTH domain